MADAYPNNSKLSTMIVQIERITRSIGTTTAWLLILMVLIESLIVLMRYGFDLGSIALQESVTYMHATVFLLGAAYTLQDDEHVRVDIFYRDFTTLKKAWINLCGSTLMLLPLCIFIVWSSVAYVEQAWSIKETSGDAGGIPAVYLLKTLIPCFAILLLLQGIAEILKSLAIIFSKPVSANNHTAT